MWGEGRIKGWEEQGRQDDIKGEQRGAKPQLSVVDKSEEERKPYPAV